MRMPSFARRHPWIGLLIVVTIAVASWMLLRAPHPATESMSLAAAGSEASKPAGPPWLYGRADARFTVVGTPTWSVRTAGPTSPRSSAGSTPIPR
jgi:hypothetical protein